MAKNSGEGAKWGMTKIVAKARHFYWLRRPKNTFHTMATLAQQKPEGK
jgi:hypothetical protein